MSNLPDGVVAVVWTDRKNRAGRLLDKLGNNVTIQGQSIPAGFMFDGLSVGKWASMFLTDYRQGREAALLHDWLYECTDQHEFTRSQADRMFLSELKARGVGRYSRTVMFLGARIGGWRAWGRRG